MLKSMHLEPPQDVSKSSIRTGVMKMVSQKTAAKIQKQKLKLRSSLWPNLDETRLWIRTQRKGFTTVPRGLPLVMKIMDELSVGKPPSSAYLDLWCRARDECFVTIVDERERAFYSGFSGQRAVSAWQGRMRVLQKLQFIDVKEGPSGPFNYVLIWNPYLVIEDLRKAQTAGLSDSSYNALRARIVEVGADDLD